MERAIMNATELVGRLDSVQPRGPGRWFAKCPAHEDKRPSLSVREIGDGTVLLHCFAGCYPLSIVQAIGLEFRDLFPAGRIRRVEDHERPRLSATDALVALDNECLIVKWIATDVYQRREIGAETWQRLALAVNRISTARALIAPARLER
jgi:hypothetical protein